MPGDDFGAIRDDANALFDRLERAEASGHTSLSDTDNREAQELEARIFQAAGAVVALGKSLLVGEEDQKDLRISVRRMSAAVRLKGYQQWDARVIFDEDVYRGTEPAGQSEYALDSVARARSEFAQAADHFSRIALAAGVIGSPADHDDLLPLLRRKNFDRDIGRFLDDAEGSQSPTALLMIDVDLFKRVNDAYGHQVGDEALKSIASVINQAVAGKGRAYRYGGEEMALLALNMTVAEAVALGERIRTEVESEERTSRGLRLTVSVGVAIAPQHATTASELVAAADTALYDAKRLGRNRTSVADQSARMPTQSAREQVAPGHSKAAGSHRPGDEPFKIPRLSDPELEKVADHYRSSGMEPVLPLLEERDVRLARGYTVAYYPGTSREVWVGFHDGSYEHILMLKPTASPDR